MSRNRSQETMEDVTAVLPHILFDEPYLKKIEERLHEQTVALSAGGKKVVGTYCAFTPKEIVAAAGGIPVSLCAGTEESFPAAEAHLPPNLCPLVKSSYGHALSDTCPYFHMADFLLADATCDGKKKMFELLPRLKPLHLLLLPQSPDPSLSLASWKNELHRAKGFLEKMMDTRITDRELTRQIEIHNRLRRTVEAVYQLNTGETPLVYGSEINRITSMAGFECDLESRILDMSAAMDKIRERAGSGEFLSQMKRRPRVLLTGCPTTNKKLLHLIEAAGGVVVAMETCGGLKSMGDRVKENGDPMTALAEKYLDIACACMSPNPKRLDLIGGLIEQYRVDGVVDLTWNACHTYNVESFSVQEAVMNRFETPYIQILTDYSQNDMGQLQTRVEAFLEMIG